MSHTLTSPIPWSVSTPWSGINQSVYRGQVPPGIPPQPPSSTSSTTRLPLSSPIGVPVHVTPELGVEGFACKEEHDRRVQMANELSQSASALLRVVATSGSERDLLAVGRQAKVENNLSAPQLKACANVTCDALMAKHLTQELVVLQLQGKVYEHVNYQQSVEHHKLLSSHQKELLDLVAKQKKEEEEQRLSHKRHLEDLVQKHEAQMQRLQDDVVEHQTALRAIVEKVDEEKDRVAAGQQEAQPQTNDPTAVPSSVQTTDCGKSELKMEIKTEDVPVSMETDPEHTHQPAVGGGDDGGMPDVDPVICTEVQQEEPEPQTDQNTNTTTNKPESSIKTEEHDLQVTPQVTEESRDIQEGANSMNHEEKPAVPMVVLDSGVEPQDQQWQTRQVEKEHIDALLVKIKMNREKNHKARQQMQEVHQSPAVEEAEQFRFYTLEIEKLKQQYHQKQLLKESLIQERQNQAYTMMQLRRNAELKRKSTDPERKQYIEFQKLLANQIDNRKKLLQDIQQEMYRVAKAQRYQLALRKAQVGQTTEDQKDNRTNTYNDSDDELTVSDLSSEEMHGLQAMLNTQQPQREDASNLETSVTGLPLAKEDPMIIEEDTCTEGQENLGEEEEGYLHSENSPPPDEGGTSPPSRIKPRKDTQGYNMDELSMEEEDALYEEEEEDEDEEEEFDPVQVMMVAFAESYLHAVTSDEPETGKPETLDKPTSAGMDSTEEAGPPTSGGGNELPLAE